MVRKTRGLMNVLSFSDVLGKQRACKRKNEKCIPVKSKTCFSKNIHSHVENAVQKIVDTKQLPKYEKSVLENTVGIQSHKKNSANNSNNNMQNIVQAGVQGALEDSVQCTVQNTGQYSVQSTVQDFAQNTGQDNVQSTVQDFVQNTGQDSVKGAVEHIVNGTVQIIVENTWQDTVQDIVQNTGQDSVQDTVQDFAQNTGQDSVQSTVQDFVHREYYHREYYRLPEDTLQVAKVSKILVAAEKGLLKDFKGKSLDEIILENNVTSDVEDNGDDNDDNDDENYGNDEPATSEETNRKPTVEEPFPKSSNTNHSASKPKLGKESIKRTPWSSEEKAALQRQLSHFFTTLSVPGKMDCENCVFKEPALKNRNWKAVKFYLHNYRQTSLRKSSR